MAVLFVRLLVSGPVLIGLRQFVLHISQTLVCSGTHFSLGLFLVTVFVAKSVRASSNRAHSLHSATVTGVVVVIVTGPMIGCVSFPLCDNFVVVVVLVILVVVAVIVLRELSVHVV